MVNRLPLLGRVWRGSLLGLVTSTPVAGRPEATQLVGARFDH